MSSEQVGNAVLLVSTSISPSNNNEGDGKSSTFDEIDDNVDIESKKGEHFGIHFI